MNRCSLHEDLVRAFRIPDISAMNIDVKQLYLQIVQLQVQVHNASTSIAEKNGMNLQARRTRTNSRLRGWKIMSQAMSALLSAHSPYLQMQDLNCAMNISTYSIHSNSTAASRVVAVVFDFFFIHHVMPFSSIFLLHSVIVKWLLVDCCSRQFHMPHYIEGHLRYLLLLVVFETGSQCLLLGNNTRMTSSWEFHSHGLCWIIVQWMCVHMQYMVWAWVLPLFYFTSLISFRYSIHQSECQAIFINGIESRLSRLI